MKLIMMMKLTMMVKMIVMMKMILRAAMLKVILQADSLLKVILPKIISQQ